MPKFTITKPPKSNNNIKVNQHISKLYEIANILNCSVSEAQQIKSYFSKEAMDKTRNDFYGEEMKDELTLGLVVDFIEDLRSAFSSMTTFEKEDLYLEFILSYEKNILSAIKQYWGENASVEFDRTNMLVTCKAPNKESIML